MFVIVVTGGLGAGKSTACEYFRSRGATVVGLDEVAARVLAKGSPTLGMVAKHFGDDVLYADGSLDRAALAREAFSSVEATAALNDIVHPAVAREVGPALAEIRMMPHQPDVVVLEVPLLAEAPVFAELADEVVAIVAPEHLRVERAVARGMSDVDARRRIRVQATDAERAEMADVVIANDRDEDAFLERLAQYWEERVAKHGGASS